MRCKFWVFLLFPLFLLLGCDGQGEGVPERKTDLLSGSNQTLTTLEGTALVFELKSENPSDVKLGYALVTEPLQGTLSGEALRVSYTPKADFVGVDTFSYVLVNGEQKSPVANIVIQVLPKPKQLIYSGPTAGVVGECYLAKLRSVNNRGVAAPLLTDLSVTSSAEVFADENCSAPVTTLQGKKGLTDLSVYISKETIATQSYIFTYQLDSLKTVDVNFSFLAATASQISMTSFSEAVAGECKAITLKITDRFGNSQVLTADKVVNLINFRHTGNQVAYRLYSDASCRSLVREVVGFSTSTPITLSSGTSGKTLYVSSEIASIGSSFDLQATDLLVTSEEQAYTIKPGPVDSVRIAIGPLNQPKFPTDTCRTFYAYFYDSFQNQIDDLPAEDRKFSFTTTGGAVARHFSDYECKIEISSQQAGPNYLVLSGSGRTSLTAHSIRFPAVEQTIEFELTAHPTAPSDATAGFRCGYSTFSVTVPEGSMLYYIGSANYWSGILPLYPPSPFGGGFRSGDNSTCTRNGQTFTCREYAYPGVGQPIVASYTFLSCSTTDSYNCSYGTTVTAPVFLSYPDHCRPGPCPQGCYYDTTSCGFVCRR